MVEPLRLIGYWRNDQHPEYPDPHDFVDPSWGDDDRLDIAGYLSNHYSPWGAMGISPCRICGRGNGSAEYSDGVYLWPEGLAHYVGDHRVRLPAEVEQHILARLSWYEERSHIDLDWWLAATDGSGK